MYLSLPFHKDNVTVYVNASYPGQIIEETTKSINNDEKVILLRYQCIKITVFMT